jgi:hypothetical protein
MCHSVGLVAVLTTFLSGGQAQPAPRIVATGQGLVLSVIEEKGAPTDREFTFSIQQAGLPESEKRFTISRGVMTSIEVARIHPAGTIAVVGATASHLQALSIVDAASASIVFKIACADLRLTPDESRYLCTDGAGKMWSYRLATREVHAAMAPVTGVIHVLSSGSLAARRRLLHDINQSAQLSTSPEVRAALLGEFNRQVTHDMEAAATSPAIDGIRTGSAERDYLGDLVNTVAQLHDPAALTLISRTDHRSAVGGLAMYGTKAVPAILHALRSNAPRGYSMYYRSGLFEALTIILRLPDVRDLERPRIAEVTRAALVHPTSWRELVQALAVAEELDDDSMDTEIEKLAHDADAVRRRGITSAAQVLDIQAKAQSVLAHRVVIR